MLFRTLLLAVFALLGLPVHADNANCPMNLDFTKRFLASDESVRLCDAYTNQVLLVVNTASYCGFTSQFEGLETLQERYGDRGFSVLGFPSNDFFQDPDPRVLRSDLRSQISDVREIPGGQAQR